MKVEETMKQGKYNCGSDSFHFFCTILSIGATIHFLMIPDVVAALPVLAHFSISVWSTHNVIHVDTDLLGLWRPARKRTYLGFIPFCVGSA